MNTTKIAAVLLISLFALSSIAIASEGCDASPWTQEATYGRKVAKKAQFGVTNLLLGWTEIFTEPVPAFKEHTNVFPSIFNGLWNAVADTIGGALHLVTAPFPGVDLPLPECGADVWGK